MIISGTTVSGAIKLGTFRLPSVPTIGTATQASSSSSTVSFTESTDSGGTPITSYTVVSNNGISASGTSSPITVGGLSVGVPYTFTVYASNIQGNSDISSPSNSLTIVTVPDAPTIGTATSIDTTTATVSFTAPSSNGGSTITSYTAISSPGGITGTISQSGSGTITVSGLTPSTSYTFTVHATNSVGDSSESSSSNSITTTAPVTGQALFDNWLGSTDWTTSWTCPAGVTSVSVLVIGPGGPAEYPAGGGSGGGGLAYGNNIAVVPGQTYSIFLGTSKTSANKAWFNSPTFLYANGGVRGTSGTSSYTAGGGGGAGGYSGNGGIGGGIASGTAAGGAGGTFGGTACSGGGNGGAGGRGYNGDTIGPSAATNGAGGGGGGGSGGWTGANAGGGVGVYGQGADGLGGTATNPRSTAAVRIGGGGSGGETGSRSYGEGGKYGAGAGSSALNGYTSYGGPCAVRIIWPGTTRQFPSTNTVDM